MLEIGKKWKSGEAGSSDGSAKGLNKNPGSKFFQTLQNLDPNTMIQTSLQSAA